MYIILLLLFVNESYGESFNELLIRLNKHELVDSELNHAKSIMEKARKSGSWGDPKLSIAAMNFPRESLSQDESMMTGIQFTLSQKLSLSGKYGTLEKAGIENSKSMIAESNELKRKIARMIWASGIKKEKLLASQKILKENLSWIKSNLKITKKLYSTGKVPQQAVLDMQIRQSELKTKIREKQFEIKALEHELSAVLGSSKLLTLETKTIPWNHLDLWKNSKDLKDYSKIALEHKLRSSDLALSASNRNLFPDVTFGVSYTKRNDIDGLGDFVGASITIPIPTSSSRYSDKKEAIYKKVTVQKKYRNYLESKESNLSKIKVDIENITKQLEILREETLQFAKSSRTITAKSYSRGGADYVELLRAELQYQKQLLKEVDLVASLKNYKLSYLFFKGDHLRMEVLK